MSAHQTSRPTEPVDELLERFISPGPEFGPLPIWWWSGAPVTRERLRWQMEQLVSQGVRQAVVMCLAPAGPLHGALADDPPFLSDEWLTLLDQACADATEVGFTLWMYDQLGFSGANFQGQLVAQRPEFAGQGLYRTAGAPGSVVCPDGHTPLHRYADGDTEVLIHVGRRGFDYFNPAAGAALLASVHGVLESRVGHWFGTAIGGFFQDELPAMPTWGPDFAQTFHEVYGYDIVPNLLALYEGETDEAAIVRHDYHEHRARLARRGFFDQQQAWYERHGLICGFDQQSPAREGDPVAGVNLYGDYLGTHSGYGAPGSDHLGDAKVHSSLAHAHGRPRTWIEAFHSSGWGGTLEETYDWLAPFMRRGATLYDPHAVYYSTHGGWWEWAAPSTCWRQPYWPSYHVFSTAIARLCSVLSAGTHVCDVAVVAPTSTAQAYLTLDGPLPPAIEAADTYHELNGIGTWFAERRGVLECAGIDHDVLDENTIARGSVGPDGLTIGSETYRTVVLPATRVLQLDAARRLVALARAGGRVVCAGKAPELIIGSDGDFGEAVSRGLIAVVDDVDFVPALVRKGAVTVRADAPFLLRRYGDAYVLMLIAHDEASGTSAPIVTLKHPQWWKDWSQLGNVAEQLRTRGYVFRPAGDRAAQVRIDGLDRTIAQRWDPRTGRRTPIAVENGGLEVSFEDGPIALVILAQELPEPTGTRLGGILKVTEVDGPWLADAESTMDNQWGDLAAPVREGVLPIEVWRMEHRADPTADWVPAVATFGPFAQERVGDGPWGAAEWSLSRGIRDDRVHRQTLGPKGRVPEEFVDFGNVSAGERVALRTRLSVPDMPSVHLAVGASAVRAVLADGSALPVMGDGYQSLSPLPAGREVEVLVEFVADTAGPLRASFAVVVDPDAYRRPAWIVPGDQAIAGQATDLSKSFVLDRLPAQAMVQLASDGPCSLIVNGIEVGRQGGFGPYPGRRDLRVHPYDISASLTPGRNEITVRVSDASDTPTAVALDSTVDLGLMTDDSWDGFRDGKSVGVRLVRRLVDRSLCLWARAHPLPYTGWLSQSPANVVVPVIPDVDPRGTRSEWLRIAAPLGTVELLVPTPFAFNALVDGRPYEPDGHRIRFTEPLAAGTPILLELTASDGRKGGALLDDPLQVTVAPKPTTLTTWEELGLRALGGQVSYRTTISVSRPTSDSARAVLDLGEVRGTADIFVNGQLTDRLVWGPWTSDVTDAIVDGDNELEIVVRGTLAGNLADASPTRAIAAGQVRTGLFGPVRILWRIEDTR